MTYDVAAWVRVFAAVGAAALVFGPALAHLVGKAKAALAARRLETGAEKAAAVTDRDMHTVLDLAARLKAAGCTEGVALCQQLIDVMLGNSQKAKR